MAAIGRALYPRGGWWRAARYMVYRLRRLPDPAYKISRGIAAGVFTSFTPLFGLHFFIAAGLAWIMGGNVVASLLATFVGNPVTFPVIAGASVELGARLLGQDHALPLNATFDAFSRVSVELWSNLKGVLTGRPVVWTGFEHFFSNVFMPYLVGGVLIGTVAGVASYLMSRPVISAYQKARIKRLKKKFEKQRRIAQEAAAKRMKKEARDG
ncbi:hypothetical protein SAMN04488012_105123 [Palleronia salina]|uniref:DUF2062 domain-containing protein n=2 Tax=Palleronia TaxID=315422 RepID=A0A1M6GX26_9RHOB|nr:MULTISPECIES: DUF2062 domain-containing protein [Palleronia]SEN10061.1 hypothetical protein SAMN04488011_102454 [Palleronia pelagia]SHJ14499.1 hypothetical protein SAMN04488012_105123 [Palleronia salina]